MTVFNLTKNQSAKILNINAQGAALSRLQSLGVKRGEIITVLGYSIFFKSVLISCGTVRIAIRKKLAEQIEVEI